MKKLLVIAVISMFALITYGCHRVHGNGSIKTETRDVEAFEAIICDGGYEVEINCQEEQSLSIETDENLLSHIKTEVRDNRLRIFSKENLSPSNNIRIAISVPNISAFTSNGSTEGSINNINNSALDIGINGSGRLNLNGKSNKVDINSSGSSRIDAMSLISEDTDIQINGSGNIHVYATNSLNVHISGSGSVKYKGEPKSVNQDINGSGSITRD